MYNNHFYCSPYPMQSNPIRYCVWWGDLERTKRMAATEKRTTDANGGARRYDAIRCDTIRYVCTLTVKLFFSIFPFSLFWLPHFFSSFLYLLILLHLCLWLLWCLLFLFIAVFLSFLLRLLLLLPFHFPLHIRLKCWIFLFVVGRTSLVSRSHATISLKSGVFIFMLSSSFIRFFSVCRILSVSLTKLHTVTQCDLKQPYTQRYAKSIHKHYDLNDMHPSQWDERWCVLAT